MAQAGAPRRSRRVFIELVPGAIVLLGFLATAAYAALGAIPYAAYAGALVVLEAAFLVYVHVLVAPLGFEVAMLAPAVLTLFGLVALGATASETVLHPYSLRDPVSGEFPRLAIALAGGLLVYTGFLALVRLGARGGPR